MWNTVAEALNDYRNSQQSIDFQYLISSKFKGYFQADFPEPSVAIDDFIRYSWSDERRILEIYFERDSGTHVFFARSFPSTDWGWFWLPETELEATTLLSKNMCEVVKDKRPDNGLPPYTLFWDIGFMQLDFRDYEHAAIQAAAFTQLFNAGFDAAMAIHLAYFHSGIVL